MPKESSFYAVNKCSNDPYNLHPPKPRREIFKSNSKHGSRKSTVRMNKISTCFY
jgi:hypothetical protein